MVPDILVMHKTTANVVIIEHRHVASFHSMPKICLCLTLSVRWLHAYTEVEATTDLAGNSQKAQVSGNRDLMRFFR